MTRRELIGRARRALRRLEQAVALRGRHATEAAELAGLHGAVRERLAALQRHGDDPAAGPALARLLVDVERRLGWG